jgi:hypothetical protein
LGLWRDLLRVLGLSSDARVHISAPAIDVVITGDPEQVRALLLVVKHELERSARWKDRLPDGKRPAKHGRSQSLSDPKRPQLTPSRQYVQPSELDEMDSPYALPDPLVMPVDEPTDETQAARSGDREASKRAAAKGYAGDMATLVPDPIAREKMHIDSDSSVESSEEGEREDTHVTANPAGPVEAPTSNPIERDSLTPPSRSMPFVTDGGPTLTPLADSDPSAKIVPKDPRS